MIRYDENIDQRFGIKLLDDRTIEKTARVGSRDSFSCIAALCNHFIRHPDPLVVPVYTFENLTPKATGHWDERVYRYTMKRLGMINDYEKEIVSMMETENYFGSLAAERKARLTAFQKEYPEMARFMGKVMALNRYHDLHSGNVLKDEEENYLLIDIEGFIRTPFNRKENDWITK